MTIDPRLVHRILEDYALPPMGRHGLPHWARVLETGLRLAELTGANERVVAHFAVFHDAGRVNESRDPDHGRRGSQLARELRAEHMSLSNAEFALLEGACIHHTDGRTEGDVTVQTCWDSDRLDLWRVGTVPDPALLCTEAARDEDLMAWAMERSLGGHTPGFVRDQWYSLEKRA